MTEERRLHIEENASAGLTEKEEIIELTDEIKAEPKNADEIIELVDEVAKTDSTGPADPVDSAANEVPEIPAAPELSAESEGASASETAPAAFPDGEIMIGDDIDEEIEPDENEQDDFVNSLGMDLETNSAISQIPEENDAIPAVEPSESDPVISGAIAPDQIEAAIEQVIMKILPEKIDSLLSAAIEKMLTREIEKVKNILLEDASGDNA